MSFTRSVNPFNFTYILQGMPLEYVSSFKDLGMFYIRPRSPHTYYFK